MWPDLAVVLEKRLTKKGVAKRKEQNLALFLCGKMSGLFLLLAVFLGVLFSAVATEPYTSRCSIAPVGLIPTGN